METRQEQISKIMSDIAKEGHKKNPRPREFYQNMVNARWKKVKNKKVDK